MKGLPIFFSGRFYAAGCIDCDGKILKNFCKTLFSTFYRTDYDDCIETKKCTLLDGHRYFFVGVPIGDKPLMHFLLEGTFNAEFKVLDPRLKNVDNVRLVRFLPKTKIPFNPVGVGLGLWSMKHYLDCYKFLQDYLFCHPFCLFLSIRARLNVLNPSDEEAMKKLAWDAVHYSKYHGKVNDPDSEQCKMAELLRGLILRKKGRTESAIQTISSTLSCLRGSLRSYAYYVLGTLTTGPVAMAHFKKSDPIHFFEIAKHYFDLDQMANANYFASRAFLFCPWRSNIVMWSSILFALDNRPLARRLLCIDKEGRDLFFNSYSKSELKSLALKERVCACCEKGGDVLFFLQCPECQKEWYCSQTCIEAHAERHRPFCSWCGYCDKKLSRRQRKWCGGCQAIFYCGHQCQMEHWVKTHHGECLIGITPPTTPAPVPTTVSQQWMKEPGNKAPK